MPTDSITYPKYLMMFIANENFAMFRYSRCCWRVSKTCQSYLTCSSHDRLKNKISSRYTMTHLPMKIHRRSSIYLMKVADALVKLKFMTNHSNNPSLVLKVIFHTSLDSIGIWWYPYLRSTFLNKLASFILLMSSSIHGRGYMFFTKILLRSQ